VYYNLLQILFIAFHLLACYFILFYDGYDRSAKSGNNGRTDIASEQLSGKE
jgi:hypothetical protein